MNAQLKKAVKNYHSNDCPLVVQSINYATGTNHIYIAPFEKMENAIKYFWEVMKTDCISEGKFEYYVLNADGSIYNSRIITIK